MRRNFKSFLDISICSVLESVNILHFAAKRKYISEKERTILYQKAETLVKKIRSFKNSLK
jgi:four helix bundle protein